MAPHQFKLPFLPIKKAPTELLNLPKFYYKDITLQEELGRGGFGVVYKANSSQNFVVVKQMLHKDSYMKKLFIKEAKMLHLVSQDTEYLVKFISVSEDPLSIMMEYFNFTFLPFGQDKHVSALSELLGTINEDYDFQGFEYLPLKIALDLAHGLEHLHKMGIAHRDLKPANCLVTNEHYCHEKDQAKVAEIYKVNPVLCKISDFDESRAEYLQTQSMVHSVTSQVSRGTPAYMAPEFFVKDFALHAAGLKDLMQADLWSMGMILFIMINPDLRMPYQIDYLKNKGMSWKFILENSLKKSVKPTMSDKYQTMRDNRWEVLKKLYEGCTSFTPDSRPKLERMIHTLENDSESQCENIFLSMSQESSMESYNLQAARAIANNASVPSDFPVNNGIKSCAFLSLAICDDINAQFVALGSSDIKKSNLPKMLKNAAERQITNLPHMLNPLRNENMMYDVAEAYSLLRENKLLVSCYHFFEKVVDAENSDFLKECGTYCFKKSVKELALTDTGLAIFTCERYIFTIGTAMGQLFLIETRPISQALGGNGNGLIKLYSDTSQDSIDALSSWVKRRLKVSGIQEGKSLQSFLVMTKAESIFEDNDCSLSYGADIELQSPTGSKARKHKMIEQQSGIVYRSKRKLSSDIRTGSNSQDSLLVDNDSGINYEASIALLGPTGSKALNHMLIDPQSGIIHSSKRIPSSDMETYSSSQESVLVENDVRIIMKTALHYTVLQHRNHQITCRQICSLGLFTALEEYVPHTSKLTATAKKDDISPEPADRWIVKIEAVFGSSGRFCDSCVELIVKILSQVVVDNDLEMNYETNIALHSPTGSKAPNHMLIDLQSGIMHNFKRIPSSDIETYSNSQERSNSRTDDRRKLTLKDLRLRSNLTMSSKGKEDLPKRSEVTMYDGIPAYEESVHILTVNEIFKICIEKDVEEKMIAYDLPSGVKDNVIFIVRVKSSDDNISADGSKGVPESDLSADDNGIYCSHSSPSDVFDIKINEGRIVKKRLLKKGDIVPDSGDIYILQRHYCSHSSNKDFKRTIIKVKHKGVTLPFAIIQYKMPSSGFVWAKPHGNSTKQGSFYQTKPSVLAELKSYANKAPPKVAIHSVEKNQYQQKPSSIPRNRKQAYYQYSKAADRQKFRSTGPPKTPDYSKLLIMLSESSFVKDVDFSIKERNHKQSSHPNTFAATNTTLNWIKDFCGGSRPKTFAGIDMTYKAGQFYTMTVSFENPIFVMASNSEKHPTTLAAISTSVTKNTEDYKFMARNLKAHGINSLTYNVDGELALEQAMEFEYPITMLGNNHLRCFIHVDGNIKNALKGIVDKETSKKIRREILGSEYNGTRVQGLVDSDSEEEFLRKYAEAEKQWPETFQEWMLKKEGRIRSLKDTLKLCMLKPVRIASGLGNPPNKCVNQRTESLNLVVKEAIGNQTTDQVTFHEKIYENIFLAQESECRKAIYGYDEYRLAESFKKYQVEASTWFQMTYEQQELHLRKLFSLGPSTTDREKITKNLSITIENSGLSGCPSYLLSSIWNKAEIILSHYAIHPLEGGSSCVTEFNDSHIVRVKHSHFECKCKTFDTTSALCAHTFVVADLLDVLPKFLENYNLKKNKASQSFAKKINKRAGNKPKEKKPRKGQQGVQLNPITSMKNMFDADLDFPKPFHATEAWHNNEPFFVVENKRYPTAKRCEKCLLDFPTSDGQIHVPFDISIRHKQRYRYPIYDHTVKPKRFIKWEVSKYDMKNKFYCVKKECIIDHHPYF